MPMDSDPRHRRDRRRGASSATSPWRSILGARVPGSRLRVIDSILGFAACLICLPIFLLGIGAGIVASTMLSAIGVPAQIVPFLAYMIIGMGGAIIVSFVVLVLIYRRLPGWIRATIAGDDSVE